MSRLERELTQTATAFAQARMVGTPAKTVAGAMRDGRAVKLTAAQRRRVREMLDDGEAYTRAEAVAWVTEMEPEVR